MPGWRNIRINLGLPSAAGSKPEKGYMLRFDVYRGGQKAQDLDLSGAYLFGQDSIPVRADLAFSNGQLSCMKRSAGACGLVVLWEAGEAGRFLLPTTRLPDRAKPYSLNLELARGQLTRIAQKREDWGLFDYPEAEELNREFERVRGIFIDALKAEDPVQASILADHALQEGVTLGEKVSLFHADIFLNRRKLSSANMIRTGFGCVVDLFSSAGEYQDRMREAFDLVSVPMAWKHTEPKEKQHNFAQADAWVNWCAHNRKAIHAGPLLSFEPTQLPDWLYIFENDYETLRDLIYEHVQHVVGRYHKQVRVWKVVSGIHAFNNFNLTFEQIMELTRMCCLQVKKLAPASQVLIELAMPWGEYYARNQRTIPPMLYADMAVQSGIKFDGFGVQMYTGVPVDGYYVRDLLQFSSMLDEFVGLGKTVHISACQAPSDVVRDPWDAWGGSMDVQAAGRWHAPWSPRLQAEWIQAFSRVALSKPFVETICWRDLADYEGHFVSHGGLCRPNLEPKLAYREMKNFKVALLSGSVELRAKGKPPQT